MRLELGRNESWKLSRKRKWKEMAQKCMFFRDKEIHIWLAAAIAAKSLQSVSNSVQPYGQQPARFLCPRDSPGKNTGVSCHFFLHIYGLGDHKQPESNSFFYFIPQYTCLPQTNILIHSQLPEIAKAWMRNGIMAYIRFRHKCKPHVRKWWIKNISKEGSKVLITNWIWGQRTGT